MSVPIALELVPTALERLLGVDFCQVTPMRPSRLFVRSPGFDSPTETWSWLFHQGVEHSRGRVFVGPDGQWRGSGEVTAERQG